jgi:hypothetical protein
MVFGLDDAAIAALATVAAGALQAGGSAMGGAANAKAAKKQAKEMKRQTLADMYNKALQRQLDYFKFNQEQEGTNTARRTAALQEMANGFTRALR